MHAYDPQGTLASYSLETDDVPFDIDLDIGRIFVNESLDREVSLQPYIQPTASHLNFHQIQIEDEYVLVATVTDTEGLSVRKFAT